MLTYKNPKAKPCEVCERLFVPERDGETVGGNVCGLKKARTEARNVLTIELPWPSPKLAPNRRNGKHWTVTHTAKLSAFGDAATLTMQALRATGYQAPADGPIGLTLTFCPPDRRRRDLDGLLSACKASLDAVAQVIGVDDVRFEPVTLRRGEPIKGGTVVLEVEC